MSELSNLARFCVNLEWKDLPAPVKEAVKRQVLLTIGVAVGARKNQQISVISSLYLDIFKGNPSAHIWGGEEQAPVSIAAFLNAMAGHTLELDDVHTKSKTHIGTVVIPAAWALAEYLGASGEEFLLAVTCGYEVMARIGMGFGVVGHRMKGWHVTSTAGTFGAAAACAKLLDLSEKETVSALGLAGTQSFGVWAFLSDGASNKVLHPARAASIGVESALLSRAGMMGSANILAAADGGVFPAMSDQYNLSLVDSGLGSHYELLHMDNKPYPCCRSTHCAIDAALALRENTGFSVDHIKAVKVFTYEVGYKQCGSSPGSLKPQTPIDAKFSIPYTVARAIIDGAVNWSSFLPEAICEQSVADLAQMVTVVPSEEFSALYPQHWGCRIEITCDDGTVHVKHISDASGSVENPLSDGQIHQMVRENMDRCISGNTDALIESINLLEIAERLPVIA